MTTALNRLNYDGCAYQKALHESVAPIDYILNPIKYENCQKCRISLGTVGGTNVSHINGNLVDLENDLFNITRPSTRCPQYMYTPTPPGETIFAHAEPMPGRDEAPPIQAMSRHLRTCNMMKFPRVPVAPPTVPYRCPNM